MRNELELPTSTPVAKVPVRLEFTVCVQASDLAFAVDRARALVEHLQEAGTLFCEDNALTLSQE